MRVCFVLRNRAHPSIISKYILYEASQGVMSKCRKRQLTFVEMPMSRWPIYYTSTSRKMLRAGQSLVTAIHVRVLPKR